MFPHTVHTVIAPAPAVPPLVQPLPPSDAPPDSTSIAPSELAPCLLFPPIDAPNGNNLVNEDPNSIILSPNGNELVNKTPTGINLSLNNTKLVDMAPRGINLSPNNSELIQTAPSGIDVSPTSNELVKTAPNGNDYVKAAPNNNKLVKSAPELITNLKYYNYTTGGGFFSFYCYF
ncbi:hypothetical protein PtA15_1A592 [Puccinia triticina]|uniref:Uncharacterized protein n=1 Tax=Puccinia triticina TaxID=208348 RepID=A0ABY7CEJ4_9BASI|nr:uncharacterized protein PtA15_1A592 [Puccinia triticina]WAQ81252.1 hypothetical protein PtA15_1A592 [Puccinia triticina]